MNNANNANMPKGRGMVKWKMFSSMPEQFVGICDLNYKFVGTAPQYAWIKIIANS